MPDNPFPGVELSTDVGAADWVRRALRPWTDAGIAHVATLVPADYPAHARVLHRAWPEPGSEPDRGSLRDDECAAAAEVLAQYTDTPDDCWFCIWEGYGWESLTRLGQGAPRVALEHRNCLLFRGPVSAATAFRSGPWFQSPTLWWPQDRQWCVASELDIYSTYVAGTTSAVQALIDHPALEVVACDPEQDIDHGPYSG